MENRQITRNWQSGVNEDGEDPWGWFEDFETPKNNAISITDKSGQQGHDTEIRQPIQRATTLPPPATVPPVYVLESSLSCQRLW